MKTIHNKKRIIIPACIVGVILVCVIVFGIYVNDFYHAGDYEVPEEFADITVEKHDGYTLYGDVNNSDIGIIFYPGGKVEAEAYEPLMYGLAEENICCVLVEMPFNLAVFGINRADDIIVKYDGVKWYMAGHSLGGAMAASYSADNSERLEGLILLAAYPAGELPEDFPVISIYGSKDKVLNIDKYNENIELALNCTEIIIDGGNHSGFGNYGFQSGDGEADISSQEQWRLTVEYIIEWMN